MSFIHKYRYLIFFLFYMTVSGLLPFFFIGAISVNIGKDYWHVFRGTYGIIFLLVLVVCTVILIAVGESLLHPFKGKGGFTALVVGYIVMVVILGPIIYFGLLNFQGL